MGTPYIQSALFDAAHKQVLEYLRADVMANAGGGGDAGAAAAEEVQANLDADRATIVADLAALRTAILAITAKLDLDEGVVTADYATANPPALTTSA